MNYNESEKLCTNECIHYGGYNEHYGASVCNINRYFPRRSKLEETSLGSLCLHPTFHPDSIEKNELIELDFSFLPWSI